MIDDDGFEYTHINGPCPRCKNSAATLQINYRTGQARCVGGVFRLDIPAESLYAAPGYSDRDRVQPKRFMPWPVQVHYRACKWIGRAIPEGDGVKLEGALFMEKEDYYRWAAEGVRTSAA